jgi:glutamate carboxypeptidase
MSLLDSALAAADRRAAAILPILRGWCAVNSFTTNVAGCQEVGGLLADAFGALPLVLERRRGDGCGDHLAWRTPGWTRGGVLLVGHHDTVFPPGTFEVWEESDGRVRAPGALDMKGGLACVHAALAALHDAGALADRAIAVISVADEETGSLDSRPFLEEVAQGAGAALVFEAGRISDAIVVARKGVGTVRVSVTGKAAHAGNDIRAGVNAIWALSRFVDRAQRIGDEHTTVNVGLMKGGTSVNTVPAAADCAIDFRFVRPPDGDAVVAELDRIARELSEETGARFVLGGGVKRPPLERTPASAALAETYGACALAEGLGAGEAALVGGGSDANTLSAIGVPSIDGLGPRGKGYHTHDEYIEVSTLAPRVRALVRFLLQV